MKKKENIVQKRDSVSDDLKVDINRQVCRI